MIVCVLSIKLQHVLLNTYTCATVHQSLTSTAAFQQMIIRLSTENDLCATARNQYRNTQVESQPNIYQYICKSLNKLKLCSTLIAHCRVSKLSAQVLQQHTLTAQDVQKHRPPKPMSASCPGVWQKEQNRSTSGQSQGQQACRYLAPHCLFCMDVGCCAIMWK